MAGESVHPQLRWVPFGFRRADVEALQARLADTEEALATVRAENDGLTTDLNTANLALGETAGWSERLPVALGDLTNLAAGKPTDEDTKAHLAAAVLALAGEHLLAKVDVSIGEPAGELYRDTRYNENGRPIRTIARLGACSVDCTWQPAVNAGPDTAEIIEGLCAAVVCSLAGVATTRVTCADATAGVRETWSSESGRTRQGLFDHPDRSHLRFSEAEALTNVSGNGSEEWADTSLPLWRSDPFRSGGARQMGSRAPDRRRIVSALQAWRVGVHHHERT